MSDTPRGPLLLGMRVDPITFEEACRRVTGWGADRESRYVCIADVNMVMCSRDMPVMCAAVNGADLVTPDGMPLVWFLRRRANPQQERVCGPDLIYGMCEEAARRGVSVGFYGSTAQTLAQLERNLIARYPSLAIDYLHAPPFRPLDDEEDEAVVEAINASGVGLLFVGLGCPRQEMWMADHRGRVQATMLGIGAAFDIAAGNQAVPPRWVQRSGLQWLYRLMKEPGRLWRRYLGNNSRFIALVLMGRLWPGRRP